MCNIGILELLYHHLFLYSLASMAKNSGGNVTIFTTKFIYDLVTPLFKNRVRNYIWVIKKENESLHHFLKRVETIASSEIDLLFINTLLGRTRYYPVYLLFKPKCKIILVAGRCTNWFGNSYRFFSPYHNIKRFVRKRMLPRFEGIVVHTDTMKDYVLAHHYEKDVFVLPFSIYEGDPVRKTFAGKVKCIVAGSIASWRRDYDGLLNVFQKVWCSDKSNVSLTLLGWPSGEYGRRIIMRCRLLKKRGFDIKFYNKYIPEEVFKDEVTTADIIINPIKLETYEYGGFTSGLVEAIRHAKPGVYPVGYIVPNELLSSSLFYDRIEELPNLIENNFLDNREFLEKLSRNAIVNSEKFSLQRVAAYFRESLLEKLL